MRVRVCQLFRAVVASQHNIRINFSQVLVRYFSSTHTAVPVHQPAMKTSQYGSWKSPISSALVTKSGVGLLEVRVDCNTERTGTGPPGWKTNKRLNKQKRSFSNYVYYCHILFLCSVYVSDLAVLHVALGIAAIIIIRWQWFYKFYALSLGAAMLSCNVHQRKNKINLNCQLEAVVP